MLPVISQQWKPPRTALHSRVVLRQVAPRRFSVEEFHRMARAGVFDEDDRLELLEGEIVQMDPVGRRHVATVNRLTRLFARVFGERVLISVQNPLVLDSGTEPQPDLVLLRLREDDYELSFPTGQDAYLVVEVADNDPIDGSYSVRRNA